MRGSVVLGCSSCGPLTGPSPFTSWVVLGRRYHAPDWPNRQPRPRICALSTPRIYARHAYALVTDSGAIHSPRIRRRRATLMSDHQAGCPCPSSSTAPSGDDLTENCESCGEATQDEADVAPVLAADFWEQPEIRSALLSRHFGRFLRTYRTSQSPRSSRPSWPGGWGSRRASSAGSSVRRHPSAISTNWTPGHARCMSR